MKNIRACQNKAMQNVTAETFYRYKFIKNGKHGAYKF